MRSNLGIISRPRIICGPILGSFPVSGSFASLYSTFWNFDHSQSEHEASLFRTEPHIATFTDGNLFRNPGCFKTVLYSKLKSFLTENIIMLTLVELNRRRVVQAVKYVIQRRAEQISTAPSTCTRRKIAISFRY